MEKAVSLLSEDIHWFGTSDREDVCNIEAARAYIADEIRTMPAPYKMAVTEESQVPTGPDSGVAFLRITLENEGIAFPFRVTAVSRVEKGTLKLCSMHFSVSDSNQQQSEYFPLTKGREKIAHAKMDLIVSTMAGGLLGGYMKPGCPFYFVNDRLLEYLGYSGKAAYITDIDGLLINGIHPNDRKRVETEVASQLAAGPQFAVDYQMRRQDGTYIWIHNIGRKTTDENGETIIISVCYDVTKEHDKQAQLDNIINALPGGVALYRLVNGERHVIYQSRGVGLLSGRTPEEYIELTADSAENAIFSEDVARVAAAIRQAADSDRVVSLDYRIPHISGGYIWINGSFKKAGSDHGDPIIHAVFSEMPQMRELLRDITEDSGVAVVVCDNKTHELLYLNQEVFSILNKADRNYEGRLCHEYLLGSSAPCPFCKNFDDGTTLREELYIPQLNRYYITQGRVLNWAGREAHIEYLTDITPIKLAQQRFSEMLQNVTSGIVVFRLDPRDGSYEIEYMNNSFCQLFEASEPALRKLCMRDPTYGVHPDDVEKMRNLTARATGGCAHTAETLRFLFPGDRTKWVRIEFGSVPRPDGTVSTYGTYYDVTTQIQQEHQLRDVIHNVPGGVCLYRWDGKKLHPVIVSEQFSKLLGETTGLGSKELNLHHVHPDDLPGLQKAVMKALNGSHKMEYTYRSFSKSQKEYLWIRLEGISVPQPDGTQLVYASYSNVTNEHQLQLELRTSQQALDVATEEAGLRFWTFDPLRDCAHQGKLSVQNLGLPEFMDHYPQSLLERDIILPPYHAAFEDAVRQIKAGRPQITFEAQLKYRDGSIHWNEYRLTNLFDEAGNPETTVCTARSIDAEKALLAKYELEKQKPTLGEKDLLFHAIFDLDSGRTKRYGSGVDGEQMKLAFATIDQAVRQAANCVIGDTAKARFLHINSLPYLKDQIHRGNLSFSFDYRRQLPDQRIIWVRNIFHLVNDPNTRESLLFEYCYDIHGQKMSEEILHAATVYDYELVAGVDFRVDALVPYGTSDSGTFGGLSGRLSYETARRNYAGQIPRQKERELFLRNSAPQTVIEQTAKDGNYAFTSPIVHPDGTHGVVKTRFAAYDAAHQIYIMTRTDVTDLLLEEERKNVRLRDALSVAQQANSAKSDFLSSMSHDIRTPMNAIVGMCELALENENDRRQIHESLSTIQSSSQLLLSLINNILDMSRIESGKMVFSDHPFSMTEEINKTAASYQVLAQRKQQTFRVHFSLQHDCCCGDPPRIHSVVDNILSNAIKYTPPGGTIIYRVTEIPSAKPGIGRYRFEISDTGIGISEEKKQHLFEPFYRGKMAPDVTSDGSGLGLSIAKAIIDLKGGTIHVETVVLITRVKD